MADTHPQLEYLKGILDKRIHSLHGSVAWYRRRFFITQMSTVVLSGAVTVLAGLKNSWITEAVASNSILVLGAVMTIVSAWGAFFAPRETWHMKADVLGRLAGLRNKLLFSSTDPELSGDEQESFCKEVFDEFEKIMTDHNLKWQELRKK
jgi:hypothetical protein